MTFDAFDSLVADFYNRDEVSDAQRLAFINMAALQIQREYDLKLEQRSASITYPSTVATGYDLSSLSPAFRSFPYDRSVTVVAGSTRTPIIGSSYPTELRRSGNTNLTASVVTSNTRYYIRPLNNGWRLFLAPEILEVSLELVYNPWLPAYAAGAAEDLLLGPGHDVLLFKTLEIGNFFQDDDNKVKIDMEMFQRALDSFKVFLGTVEGSGAPIDLD